MSLVSYHAHKYYIIEITGSGGSVKHELNSIYGNVMSVLQPGSKATPQGEKFSDFWASFFFDAELNAEAYLDKFFSASELRQMKLFIDPMTGDIRCEVTAPANSSNITLLVDTIDREQPIININKGVCVHNVYRTAEYVPSGNFASPAPPSAALRSVQSGVDNTNKALGKLVGVGSNPIIQVHSAVAAANQALNKLKAVGMVAQP